MDRKMEKKQYHEDDLIIVLDVSNLTAQGRQNDWFNPDWFFQKTHKTPILILNQTTIDNYQGNISKAIQQEAQKKKLNIQNIKNVKFIDIQHSSPDDNGRVYVHDNQMCIDVVNAINTLFPNIKRTKMISTACHSETVDEKDKDLRVELYNAVNGQNWQKGHQLDLYLTPFNEIDGKFVLNKERNKIKQHVRLMNDELSPYSEACKKNEQQRKDAQELLQFMMCGHVYSYGKDNDGAAKISLQIREYEPNGIETDWCDYDDQEFVRLKRKKTAMNKGKYTLKPYCTLKEMSNFLEMYYMECEKKLNAYFEKYPYSDQEIKEEIVKERVTDVHGKKRGNYIKEIIPQEKKARYDELFSIVHETNDYCSDEAFEMFDIEHEALKNEENRVRESLNDISKDEKTRTSINAAAHLGPDKIKRLLGDHVRSPQCYLPRRITNLPMETEKKHKSQKEL